MSVLVFVENIEGNFKKSAFEVVSYGKAVAEKLKTEFITLSIGNTTPEELNKLAKYGAKRIISVQTADLAQFANQAYASVIVDVAKSNQANIVVLSNSFSGKGLAARIAAKLEAAIVLGAIDLPETDGEKLITKKTVYSNKAIATIEMDAANKVISVNPNSFETIESPETASIENYTPSVPATDFSAIIKEIVRSTDKISLPEAEIVVSAGRGLKGPENWGMIEDLATVLGAATACSKPVSDAGWRPHSEHVGQTGLVISPNLYIAIGISGAIQHLAGVSSSKTIVVINKDPEAPFFKVADYGIVGDAFEVVPKLTAAIKAYKG